MTKLKGKARQRANKKARNQAINKKFLVNRSLRESIRKWDDPILTQVCENVNSDENVSSIIRKMKASIRSTKNGVGLSAPQIGEVKNIIAIRSNRISNNVEILINPNIKEKSPETSVETEGCLSYPDIYIEVERSKEVLVEYFDEKRELQSRQFVGTESRIIQHECDHLIGKCVIGDHWRGVKAMKAIDEAIESSRNDVVDATSSPVLPIDDINRSSDPTAGPDSVVVVPSPPDILSATD